MKHLEIDASQGTQQYMASNDLQKQYMALNDLTGNLSITQPARLGHITSNLCNGGQALRRANLLCTCVWQHPSKGIGDTVIRAHRWNGAFAQAAHQVRQFLQNQNVVCDSDSDDQIMVVMIPVSTHLAWYSCGE